MQQLRAFFIALLVFAPGAAAHDADIVYVQVAQTGAVVTETMTLTEAALALLIPMNPGQQTEPPKDALVAGVWMQSPLSASGALCALEDASSQRRPSYVELRARFRCPEGELQQRFKILSVLPRGFRVIVDRAGHQQFAEGDAQTVLLSTSSTAPTGAAAAPNWVLLGGLHIFMGIDHLAFLLALLLTAGSVRRVVAMVTSFTVAHSITLAMSALGVWTLSEHAQRGVEAVIALSIVFVAAQNLVQDQPRHRPALTFTFGLIHGFGFASVLQSYGVQASPVRALFGFNLGVELGQLAFVAVIFPLLHVTRRWSAKTVLVGSVLTLIAGGYWLTERLLS